jgi:hypothetical protein
MHSDTLAAVRLLALALASHPEDIHALAIYGDIPGHLADVVEDHLEEAEGDE